jgi:hypothetical protein
MCLICFSEKNSTLIYPEDGSNSFMRKAGKRKQIFTKLFSVTHLKTVIHVLLQENEVGTLKMEAPGSSETLVTVY